MAIDSHTHINSLVTSDINKELNKINNQQISAVINVGLNYSTSEEIVKLSQKNSTMYGTVGIHPLYIANQNLEELYKLADNNKIVAIGEIGLDYKNNNFEKQKEYFIKQIFIANELHLPVIVHANNMTREIIEIFEQHIKPKYGCVFHCFKPDLKDLVYIVSNGFYISFADKITYPTAKKSLEVAKVVPKELFLVETDAPYNNHSHYGLTELDTIIEKLAEIRQSTYEEIEKQTEINTKRLFKL